MWHEQGLGDTIQFSRYLKLLKNLGHSITFEVQPSLFRLLSESIPDAKVVETGDPLITNEFFDYQIPLMSLPRLIEAPIMGNPYIGIPKDNQPNLMQYLKLLPGNQKRIGIVCSGNVMHANDHNRSIPLKLFEGMLGLVNPILLQNQVRREDEETLVKFQVIRLGADIKDFADTAALISQLDLVISVDTSVAHLCGAMGLPVWILLAYENDSRWMAEGSKTAWYESAVLLRQNIPGDWTTLIAEVEARLKEFLVN